MSDEEAIVEVEVVSAEVVDSSTSLNAANVLESEPAVIEDVPFEEIDIKRGLFELDSALKEGGDKKEIRWAQYEFLNGDFEELEGIFTKCLKINLSVPLWKLYLSYVKNYQIPQISDESEGRQTMLKAYEFAVGHVGLDVASGPIWTEYIEFCQGNYFKLVNDKISTWEQQQLMDLTRKVYHRALLIPMEGLETLWHAYDLYENSLNKLTAKKLIAEKSSAYMAARSATRELMEIVVKIDLDGYPLNPETELTERERADRVKSWMTWISWEKRNPMGSGNKPMIHSRIVYAFRRALMTLRRDDSFWMTFISYLRFEAFRLDDCEIVLKQAHRQCPMSLSILSALTDLMEFKGGDLETVRQPFDQFNKVLEENLSALKGEIIESSKTPLDSDEELLFTSALSERRLPTVSQYLKLRCVFNAAQVELLNLARRLGGLTAARLIFASARKSQHATAVIFSAAANLEFRIRKDVSIASKIYELGLNRFSNDLSFSREYLNFLLNQNDDGNVRALFERIVANVEAFRSTHSREVIALNEDVGAIKGIWEDFYKFESQIGDYQSVGKLEERMRSAFPDEFSFQPDNLFNARHQIIPFTTTRSISFSIASETSENENYYGRDRGGTKLEFSLPIIRGDKEGEMTGGPFYLDETIFNLFLQIKNCCTDNQKNTFDGPKVDIDRFISFIERVSLPSTHTQSQSQMGAAGYRQSQPQPQSQSSSRHTSRNPQQHQQRSSRRSRNEIEDTEEDNRREKHSRTGSSIFEDRRRY